MALPNPNGNPARMTGAVLYDSTGNPVDVIDNQLKVVTAGFNSINNSSAAPLGIDGVFTGTSEKICDYASIAIILKTDQDSATDGFTLEWSPDGTNWDHIETHSIIAGVEFTTQAMIEVAYFRATYTNGGIAQTFFRLQVIYMQTPSLGEVQQLKVDLEDGGDAQLVRAVLAGKKPNGDYTNVEVTAGGNTKVSLEEWDASLNTSPIPVDIKSPSTAFGELLVGQLYPQFQGSFEYTVSNTDLNTNTITNGGTVTQATGMGVVSSSTTTNSTALFQSKQHAKYRPGLGGNQRFTALFETSVASTEQYFGIMDETGISAAFKNGYAIGFDGTTFGIHRFQNDVKTTIALADCDDPLDGSGASGMTYDPTKVNVFEIKFQYLGVGAIQYGIEDDSTGRFVVFHTILYANNNIVPSVYNPNFFFTIWVDNKATTTDLVVKSASYAYFVEGKTSFVELHQPENSSGLKEKTTVITEVAIFSIRNKSTYASKTNFIDILLLGAAASIEANQANNLGSVRIVKNATLGGTPSWSDISTSDSVVEIDTSGTTVAGGKDMTGEPLAGKNDKAIISLIDFKIILNPGEILTFAGLSANSATIDARTSWRELF